MPCVIPPIPPLGHLILSGICNLVGLVVGSLSENLCPAAGVVHLSILLEEAVKVLAIELL